MLMSYKRACLVREAITSLIRTFLGLSKFSNKISFHFCHLPFHELDRLLSSFIVKLILKAILKLLDLSFSSRSCYGYIYANIPLDKRGKSI